MKPMFMGERIRQDVSTHLNRIISTHFEHLLIDVRVIHWHKVCSLHKKVPCCLNYLPTLMQRYTFLFIRLSFASAQNVFVIHISPPHQQLFYSISDLARAGWRPNGAQGKRSDTLGFRIVESPRPVRAKAFILKHIRLVEFYTVW